MKTSRLKMTLIVAIAMSALAVCLLALAACGGSVSTNNTSFSLDSDDSSIHVVAKNGADNGGVDSIEVKSAAGLNIKSNINKGSFHVKITDSTGKTIFDQDIKESTTTPVPAEGKIEVEIEASAADGSLDILQA